MPVVKFARVCNLIFFLCFIKFPSSQSKTPSTTAQAFKPKGFEAPISRLQERPDKDIFDEDPAVSRHVANKRATDCQPSLTTVYSVKDRTTITRRICSGQTIFEDNFDSLHPDIWEVEQYIPVAHTDYPFVSYQPQAVSINDGKLQIKASLQQNEPGYNHDSIITGELDLSKGCTSQTESCHVQASGADILPPVVAGRILCKQFAFTYGTVHVRAKFPLGDWLYPEILLEPLVRRYVSQHNIPGFLKIASALGNRELRRLFSDYGNKVLYGGAVLDAHCPDALMSNRFASRNWADEFHIYSVRWSPENITLLVDGDEWGRIDPVTNGLRNSLPAECLSQSATNPSVEQASGLAPFDNLFYLTLGIDAGGTSEFKDNTNTEDSKPKPWTNQGRKARLNFWKELHAWHPTWTQPELLVDYIKVEAL